MFKYFIKRLILAALSLVTISILVYFLIGATGRNPISPDSFRDKAGVTAHEQWLQKIRALGLDKSIAVRFGEWVKGVFLCGDFGKIYGKASGGSATSIPTLFFGPLKYSLLITVPTFIISTIFGVVLGFVAGYKRGTWIDSIISVFVMFFIAVPSFILAAFALSISDKVGLPSSFIRPEDGGYKKMIRSIIMPILVMTLSSLAVLTYYTRNEVVTILQSNQITIARSKGMDEWEVFKKHVLRNSSIPLVALIIPSFILLLAGSIVIESFFQVPGSSRVIVTAVSNSEYNIIMFNVLFFTLLSLLSSILVDILYTIIDPRIRFDQTGSFKSIQIIKGIIKRKKHNSKHEVKHG
ncbi:MAG: ABC transporter permease [Mycoplasma sp.]|nr:ABC transporter permease [Mycoplasma sp.]